MLRQLPSSVIRCGQGINAAHGDTLRIGDVQRPVIVEARCWHGERLLASGPLCLIHIALMRRYSVFPAFSILPPNQRLATGLQFRHDTRGKGLN
jgi:hypothetical protein